MQAIVDRAAVERFARQSLGCACPDEVFERIEFVPRADWPGAELVIGDRLLIHIYEIEASDVGDARIRQHTEEGVRARDARGLNRFRLVLAAERPEAVEAAVRSAFERLALPDERVHLHVLARAQWAAVLAAARTPQPVP